MQSTATLLLPLLVLTWATAHANLISPREYYPKFLDPLTIDIDSGDDIQFSVLELSSNRREGALYGNISVGEPSKVFKVLFDTVKGNYMNIRTNPIAMKLWKDSDGMSKHSNGLLNITFKCQGESFSWLISSGCILHECLNRTTNDHSASSKYENVQDIESQYWNLVYGLYGEKAEAFGNHLASDVFDVGGIQVRQSFGRANYITKRFAAQVADGVLGLAFHPSKWPVTGVKSFLQNALDAKRLAKPVFSIFSIDDHAEVLFGEVDPSKFIGGLTYLNVTEPDSWKILIDDVVFNGKPLGMAHEAYVDTGSNILLAPKVVAEAINKRLHATVFSLPGTSADGLWAVDCSLQQFHLSSWLGLSLNGNVFELPTADIVMERVAEGDARCFSGIQSSRGPYWVLGGVFIQNYYFAFDNSTETARIGIAHLRD